MRMLRRHWLQFAALGVVAAALAVLWLVGSRGGSSASGGPSGATTSRTAVPSPTADPRVEQVGQAAMAYVQAVADAQRTGSPDQLDALTVDGSQAQGNAGTARRIATQTGHTFIVSQLSFQSVQAQVQATSAIAAVTFEAVGFDAKWPSLQPISTTRSIPPEHETLQLQLVNGRWLVDSVM